MNMLQFFLCTNLLVYICIVQGYYEHSCKEYSFANILVDMSLLFLNKYLGVEMLSYIQSIYLTL